MDKRFFVQIRYDDGCVYNHLWSDYELLSWVDMLDCYDNVLDYHVFDTINFNHLEEIYYAGWLPNCVLRFVNINGKTIVEGYGTDH